MDFKNSTPLQIVKYVFECYRQHDFSQFDKIVHPDCNWFFPGKEGIIPWAGNYKGLAILDFLEIIKENLTHEYYNDNTYYQDGAMVIVLCDEVFTVKSTGNEVYNKLSCFFEVKDGKITDYFEYSDTGAMERGYTG